MKSSEDWSCFVVKGFFNYDHLIISGSINRGKVEMYRIEK